MRIRPKTTIAVVGTLILLIVGLFVAMSTTLNSEFQRAQAQNSRANIERVVTAYRSQVNSLQSLVTSWAYWNATYAFILNRNSAYLRSNLNTASIASLGLNVMIYFNSSHRVVYSTGFDTANGTKVALPKRLLGQLNARNPLLQFPNLTSNNPGLILIGHRLLLLDAASILTSNATGPARGELVFGRYVNAAMVANFRQLSDLPVTLALYHEKTPKGAFAPVPSGLSLAHAYTSIPTGRDTIVGFALLPNIYGRPVAVLEAQMHRTIYLEGVASLRFLVIALIIAGLAFLILTLGLLDRMILSRVTRLYQGVQAIRSRDDLSLRVPVSGSDELSELSSAINRMLNGLQESLQREQKLRVEVQELRIEIDQTKRKREVARIVESDYFQDIQRKVEEMRKKKDDNQAKEDP